MKPETFWIVITGYSLKKTVLEDVAQHKSGWAKETGLNIASVEYKAHKLLWSFTDIFEAKKACSQSLIFGGTIGVGR